jgi:hypothetical protein
MRSSTLGALDALSGGNESSRFRSMPTHLFSAAAS